jgi:hypothetical protein
MERSNSDISEYSSDLQAAASRKAEKIVEKHALSREHLDSCEILGGNCMRLVKVVRASCLEAGELVWS